jgi:hypothetical protein
MSVGNTKDYGNKWGNNFPYQLAVLKLLDQIANVTPASAVSDAYFEGATNAATIALYQAWKVANPTRQVVSRIMMVDNTTLKSGLYIEYI